MEKISLPQEFYHATYRRLLDSILKHGLGGIFAQSNRMWYASRDNMVYLSTKREIAINFAISADNARYDDRKNIVVLKVDGSRLDPNLLDPDDNVFGDNYLYSWQYNGIVLPEAFLDVLSLDS